MVSAFMQRRGRSLGCGSVRSFAQNESGAATTDYVVIAALVGAVTVALMLNVSSGTADTAMTVNDALSRPPSLFTAGGSAGGIEPTGNDSGYVGDDGESGRGSSRSDGPLPDVDDAPDPDPVRAGSPSVDGGGGNSDVPGSAGGASADPSTPSSGGSAAPTNGNGNSNGNSSGKGNGNGSSGGNVAVPTAPVDCGLGKGNASANANANAASQATSGAAARC
jgi:Flp pilus assembly pilin Flp